MRDSTAAVNNPNVFMPVQGCWDKKAWKPFPSIPIPWAMISPHELQAKANHCGQDLAKLASRGGLSPCEALAILDDRKWSQMDDHEAHTELSNRVEAYVKNNGAVRFVPAVEAHDA